MADVELCIRCGTDMEWRHGTWQCPCCRLKLGCCEGEPGPACAPRGEDRYAEQPPARGSGTPR